MQFAQFSTSIDLHGVRCVDDARVGFAWEARDQVYIVIVALLLTNVPDNQTLYSERFLWASDDLVRSGTQIVGAEPSPERPTLFNQSFLADVDFTPK